MPMIVRVALFHSLLLLVSAYALARGGRPERQTVLIFFAGMFLTWSVVSPIGHRFQHPEYGIALVDTIVAAALIAVALRADRFWPAWMAAMQIVAVLCHVAMILHPVRVPDFYYKNTIQLWSYPQLLLLAAATLRHRLRTVPSAVERGLGRLPWIGRGTGDDAAVGRVGRHHRSAA